MIADVILEWLDIRSILLGLSVFLLLNNIMKNRDPANFPPGPWHLPFVGNIFTAINIHTVDKLTKQYGDIFSLRKSREKLVFVSGYKLVREALVGQADCFIDRPDVPLFNKVFKGIGIILSNGYMWKMQRKFANTHLKYFSEGRKTLEKNIVEECNILCQTFKDEQDKPFDPQFIINNAVGNIIALLVFGHRFDYSDERFVNLLRLDSECVYLSGVARAQLYNECPKLFDYLPGPHQVLFSNYEIIVNYLKEEIEKHKENWDPTDPHDFIDTYLGEMEKKKDDPEAGFNLETLTICLLDMFEAGTESVSVTLRWSLLFMIKYPEVRKKVQAEIDRVIGQSRQPVLADRDNMHYTNAVIHEVQRVSNIIPLGFPKMATRDITLNGYFIPKGTSVTANLSSVLNDKSEWETPEVFNPGHFLDSEGHFRRRDAFYPFSVGKRACLGEQQARIEMFLFFTALMQMFNFSPPPGEEVDLEPVHGFTVAPKPFKLCAIPR